MTEPSRWYTRPADDDLVCFGPDGCGARVADLALHEQDHRRREQLAAAVAVALADG